MGEDGHPPVYLDYNATAPLLPGIGERMVEVMRELPGNPSSPHRFGQAAKEALEGSRRRLAAVLGVERRELIFTSGGSESNATILSWLAGAGRPGHLITSSIEHPSLLRNCEWLAEQGVEVSYLPVDGNGMVEIEALPELMRPETALVSMMAANNETGVLQPVGGLVDLVRKHQGKRHVIVHADAAQALGRLPSSPDEWGVDAATYTAHKLGGPKGIGALVLRGDWRPEPLIRGGSQESGLRAGTESVALAEGFAAAAESACQGLIKEAMRLARLREKLIGLLRDCPGYFINGAGAPHLPNTVSLGFEGVAAESLLVAADLSGVAVSAGAACQSGAVEPSHVLRAMGLPEERVGASIRISMGHSTTAPEIERCAEVLRAEVKRIGKSAGRRVS